MAKNIQNTTQVITNNFIKGLNKDADPSYVQDGMWTHARNASNNTFEGGQGTLSNESSNYLCFTTGTTMIATAVEKRIIGAIQLFSDKWIIYTAGHKSTGEPVMSEIGLFEEDRCLYRPIVQDACLNFDKRYLISGASRETEDCSWQIYWADGLNPDRFLNVGDPKTWPTPDFQWIGQNYYSNIPAIPSQNILWPGVAWIEKTNVIEPVCETVSFVNKLNCDAIRLARLMKTPCLNLTLGTQGGTLRNGTYFATIAYSIKGQKISDYFSQSNNQPIWNVNDVQGSLSLLVEADSVNFDEFILVIVQNINQGTVAKQIGIYSTKTNVIALDQIKDDLITVPLEFIPIQSPVFEKSDQIAEINNYLLRVGPTSKFDFNYQPLANLIKTKWASVEYPSAYYVNGGNKGSYLRDESYSYFIRWIYDTGDKTASYHIPGRVSRNYTIPGSITQLETASPIGNPNVLRVDNTVFQVFNTASQDVIVPLLPNATPNINSTQYTLPDGGIVIASGDMGYWESTEKYPDHQPEIWNSSFHCWTGKESNPSSEYDLCGLPIRHHKFPDNCLSNNTVHFKPNNNHYQTNDLSIRLMGVFFENIIIPKDNDGVDIPGITGYEILRGSREGNKSIIAKGMLNNFRSYNLKGASGTGFSSQTIRKGLYANYPFNTIFPHYNNNNINNHNYQYNDPYFKIPQANDKSGDKVDKQSIPREILSFHSPDTMFRNPFLSNTELKVYGYLRGSATQQFINPSQHPEFKLLADFALGPMFLAGLIEAFLSIRGEYTINNPSYTSPGYATDAAGVALVAALAAGVSTQVAYTVYNTALESYFNGGFNFAADTLSTIVGAGTPLLDAQNTLLDAAIVPFIGIGGSSVAGLSYSYTRPKWSQLDPITRTLQISNQLLYYFSEGAETAQKLILAIIPYNQFALQMIAHGFYTNMIGNNSADIFRYKIEDSFYIKNNIQQVPTYNNNNITNNYSINNLKRSDTVVIRTKSGPNAGNANTGPKYITDNTGKYIDQSLTTLGNVVQKGVVNLNTLNPISITGIDAPDFKDIDGSFTMPIASHYAALKVNLKNQYGQLQSVKQIVITPCEQKLENYTLDTIGFSSPSCVNVPPQKILKRSSVFFGGDTFINRYTEKNTMFMFYDWLYQQPNGFEYNYNIHKMIPSPRFWVNSKQYDLSNLAPTNWLNPIPGTGGLPSDFYRLDYDNYDYENDPNQVNYPGLFRAKDAFFYLTVSGVKDFFVESDVLVDFREMGEYEWSKNYDANKYTDLVRMFDINPDSIDKGNTYRYDYSLSISKLYNQYFSSGNLQSSYYNPLVAQLCYTYYPDRIIYSLPQQLESFKDSWFTYLTNNYKEFISQISGVKSINKSGLVITFKNDSPLMFQGVDQLQTDLGTKITIGDGGLFSQPGQKVTNADRPYEYGSSQNRLSVINTPAGLFYVSQNQGKIFSYGSGLKEISQSGLKWWFNLFLPYKLIKDFPEYPWQDNSVAGIGIQSLYDNTNSILYFSKKDYSLRTNYVNRVTYIPLVTVSKLIINGIVFYKGQGDFFILDNNINSKYRLGDTTLFKNASWTVSYDPKNNFWISHHDWHPDFVISTKSTFLTTQKNASWKHNNTCNSFCNYYGINYPFEIELPIITGQSITTLKSVEYILECYKRSINCVDQYQVLDSNFDKAVLFNMEQVSGYLNLNIFPKNNVVLSLQYPKLNNSIPIEPTLIPSVGFDILFSKEENKYRFNQFWDITKDRGELPIGSLYPPTGPLITGTTQLLGNYNQENLWVTEPNGYIKLLNPSNLDINKSLLQRKKFRHYLNFLYLRKDISNNINMVVKFTNVKNQISNR